MLCLLGNVYRPFFQSSGAFYILNVHFDFVDHVFRDGISSLSLLSLVGFQVKRYTCYMKKKPIQNKTDMKSICIIINAHMYQYLGVSVPAR